MGRTTDQSILAREKKLRDKLTEIHKIVNSFEELTKAGAFFEIESELRRIKELSK